MAGAESTNDAGVEESRDERQKLASNTNEDQLEDDDVKAHGISEADADEDASERDKLAANTNEDAAEDD